MPLFASMVLALALPAAESFPISYEIRARVDPSVRRLTGRVQIVWKNTANVAADELRFHLYWNAFASEQTTLMREGRMRRGLADPEFGRVDVTAAQVDGVDLTSRWEFISPDDGNEHDRTVARLPLLDPVGPGESARIELTFESKIPGIWMRAGQERDYLAMGQWFPKLGVFESPDGDPSRPAVWNCPQFHHKTEFYAQHGSYRVQLTLPAEYRGKIAATGTRLREVNGPEPGTILSEWQAYAVHDFAWFADPDFVVLQRQIEGRGVKPGGVSLEVYLQPDHLELAERHFRPLEFAMRWFGEKFGEYPYDSLRAIDPQHDARESEGMEYPGVVTCGATLRAPSRMAVPESVIVHEVGHQWFYGLVGNDEFQEPVLDEGLNSFAEKTCLAEQFGPERETTNYGAWHIAAGVATVPQRRPAGLIGQLGTLGTGEWTGFSQGRMLAWFRNLPPLTHQPFAEVFPSQRRRGWLEHAGKESVRGATWRSPTRDAMRAHVYSLPALTIEAYRRAMGTEVVFSALRDYVARHAFQTAHVDDVVAAFDAAQDRIGSDPRRFGLRPRSYFQQVWDKAGWVDFYVRDIQCPRDQNGGCEVIVGREGVFELPVEIELEYEDSSRERVVWNGQGVHTTLKSHPGASLVAVRIDPDRVWVFDLDYTNNSERMAPSQESLYRIWLAAFHELAQRITSIGRFR
jgi:hypothetical protein